MRRLVLRNLQSPGDILMLAAVVRDLHRCHRRAASRRDFRMLLSGAAVLGLAGLTGCDDGPAYRSPLPGTTAPPIPS